MIRVGFIVFLLLILFSGVGIEISNRLNFKLKSFAAPLGFACFLCALQLGYYPVQIMHGSFTIIAIYTSIIILVSVVIAIKNWRELFKNLFRVQTIWVLVSFVVFFIVFYFCYLDIEFSDSPMYLNYIAQNINNSHLNLFNLYSGLVGQEWDGLYLYQGYYHFGSYLCWLANLPFTVLKDGTFVENIITSTWGLGMIYSLLSSMVIVDIVNYFDIKSKIFKFSLLAFTLFYSNFYYWRVVYSYYGNTYRTLMAVLLIFFIYRWLKEDNDKLKYAFPLIVGCGLACSSSYLFISFIILYILAAFLFITKYKNTIHDMSIFIIPIVIYACVMITRSNLLPGLLIIAFFIAYYLCMNLKPIKAILSWLDELIQKQAKLIFIIIIPVLVMIASFAINKFIPDYVYNYAYYWQNHRNYDMVNDYLFIYSSPLENVLNVIRWVGVILIIVKASKKEDKFIRLIFILMIIMFMNPLSTTFVSYTIASNVFYRSVEVIFNPFTETLMIIYLYQFISKYKPLQYGLSIILIVSIVLGHYESITYNGSGNTLYGFYYKGGKDVNHIFKMKNEELMLNQVLKAAIANDENLPTDRQPVIISHANATRTVVPNAYQIINARNYFYANTIVDNQLYDIGRYHHDWEDNEGIDYSNTCALLSQYDVDYMIVQYWDNDEFDKASDACSITIYEGAEYKLKRVTK